MREARRLGKPGRFDIPASYSSSSRGLRANPQVQGNLYRRYRPGAATFRFRPLVLGVIFGDNGAPSDFATTQTTALKFLVCLCAAKAVAFAELGKLIALCLARRCCSISEIIVLATISRGGPATAPASVWAMADRVTVGVNVVH